MAQSASDTNTDQSSTLPSADLGANEWLVDEMREQYDADPASVGPEWVQYFRANGSGGGGTGVCALAATTRALIAIEARTTDHMARRVRARNGLTTHLAGAQPRTRPRTNRGLWISERIGSADACSHI